MIYSNGKLNLVNIGSNMTELRVGSTSIMFSYQTPVAGYDDKGAFRTKAVSYTHLTLPTIYSV